MGVDWAYILSLIFISSGMVMCFSVIVLRFTLDRRVRRMLPVDKKYDSPLDWYFGFMRSIGFAYAAVLERANHYAIRDYYNGINIKKFANRYEKITSFIFLLVDVCFFSVWQLSF